MARLGRMKFKSFSLAQNLNEVYASFPEAQQKPLIGLTTNFNDGDATIRDKYYMQVVKAGGTPVLIPPVDDNDTLVNTLEHLDGLLLTGGADFNPLWCGEEPAPQLHHINAQRDRAELMLTRLAYNRQIPMLGICRGIQTLAMALGGKVRQDIALTNTDRMNSPVKHSQDADRQEPTHSVDLVEGSVLASLYGCQHIYVNSFHHQAVGEPGEKFRVTAKAPDGVIEAIESTEFKGIMGVQWHPEWLGEEGQPVFQWLVREAALFHQTKELHERILTLDTHCDTPMFFPQGVRFDQRDPRILYDLHKMTDGRQDAVIMVAYLPQPKLGQQFSQTVDIAGILKHNPDMQGINSQLSPMAYADLIFDKLERIVDEQSQYISVARTPADLYEDKRQGRKSIMFGIENGLALNHDVANVRHFAQRGVVYKIGRAHV